MHASEHVRLCSRFTALPNKTTFSPKLVTEHCQGLNLYFVGFNYVSFDVEACDLVPDGLDCPELELEEVPGEPGDCPLCNSPDVLKFLKAKGIEYTPDPWGELRDEAEEGPVDDAGDRAKGKAAERSGGESEEGLVGESTGEGGGVDITNRAREMLERARSALADKRARSELAGKRARSVAESTSASMGWD